MGDDTEKLWIAAKRGLMNMGDDKCGIHSQLLEKYAEEIKEMKKDTSLIPRMYNAVCGGLDESNNNLDDYRSLGCVFGGHWLW